MRVEALAHGIDFRQAEPAEHGVELLQREHRRHPRRRGLLRPFDARVSANAVIGAVEKLLFAVLREKDVGDPFRATVVSLVVTDGGGTLVVPPGTEAEWVSDAGDLKEAALWSPQLATVRRRATVIRPSGLATLTDEDERLEAVQDVIRHLMENAVHIGLYTPGWEWVFAARPEVEGFKVGAFLHPMFQDVKLTK